MRIHRPGPGPVGPDSFIESYKLSISYGPDGTPHIDTEIMESGGPKAAAMSLHEGKTQLQNVLNGVIKYFELPKVKTDLKMNPLPGKCA